MSNLRRAQGSSNNGSSPSVAMRHLLFLLLYLSSGVTGVGPKNPSAAAPAYTGEAAAMFGSANADTSSSDIMTSDLYDNFNFMTPGGVDRRTTEECRVKNLKQQERMTMAKLDAHRCLVRDTVVAVPSPETLIAEFVHPSHVVVQRCTGRISFS